MTDTKLEQYDFLHEIRRTHVEASVDSVELSRRMSYLSEIVRRYGYNGFIIHYIPGKSHLYFPMGERYDLSGLIDNLKLVGVEDWNLPITKEAVK